MSMEKYYTPTEWENYPSEDTAINAMRLNHAEDGINELDDRIVELSTDKSEVDWNQVLLSGEKIAEITINGIKKDVYTSNDSAKAEAQAYKAEGYATGEQNGIPVESGSPYYHNNSKYFSEESASHAEESSGFADDAEESSFDAEAWAVGERDGVPVPSTDPTYNNNAKHYCEEARHFTPEGYEELIQDVEDLKVDKIDKTAVDEKTTTTGQFETINGGKLESCVINIEPKQSGSGTPSPSNVRPITGHSSVEVWEHGKNLLDESGIINGYTIGNDGYPNNTQTSASKRCSIITPINVSECNNVILSFVSNNANTKVLYSLFNGSTLVSRVADISSGTTIDTSSSNKLYICWYSTDSSETISTNNLSNVQVEEGSRATDYEPYQGQDIIVNLGGTYYSGKYDFVSGVLTANKVGQKIKDMSFGYNSSGEYFRTPVISNIDEPTGQSDTSNIIAETYRADSYSNWSNNGVIIVYSTASNHGRIWLKDTRYTTLEDFITAMGEYYIVYGLATPITIQLTPQQINTLIGENHLDVPLEGQTLDSAVYRELFAWDDVEDVVELRLPISAIGTDESNNDNSSQAYSQGDYFYKNGIAKAKTNIASGATFTLGTNYEIKTLAEILKALES